MGKSVTLWSKSLYGGNWVIERTYALFYVKAMIGIESFGEFVEINGRAYSIFEVGQNPNDISKP